MSPLVTILVIMLLTVVYNESQCVTDYQDVYQNLFKGNLIEFCDPFVQKKLCENSVYGCRQLRDNNVIDYDDEDSQKYHEIVNDDFYKKFNQKRNYHHIKKKNGELKCDTVIQHYNLVDDYFPNLLFNKSCTHPDHGNSICSKGSHCQPDIHKVRVLKRRHRYDPVDRDIPPELRACWTFEYVPIEIGCSCSTWKI